MRRHAPLLLAFTLAALAGSCGGQPAGSPGTASPARKLTIAVIPKGTTHEFWKSVHAGAIKASREFGVEILWQGPLKEDDREDQIKVVDTIAARGVAGIALAPLDDKALRAPVAAATRAGIPVVLFDSALDSNDPISLVATDNYLGGRMAGDHLAKLLGPKGGGVIMLRLHEGAASTTDRERGFLEAIAHYPQVKVISSNQYAGALAEGAFRVGENLLAATRAAEGEVEGIFCPNESTTFGMLRALQSANLAGKIRFVGFDSSDKLVDGLRSGQIDALVLQNPFAMGYLSVQALVRRLKGEKVDRRIDTGVALVTRDNMEDPAIKERLQPNLTEYLK